MLRYNSLLLEFMLLNIHKYSCSEQQLTSKRKNFVNYLYSQPSICFETWLRLLGLHCFRLPEAYCYYYYYYYYYDY